MGFAWTFRICTDIVFTSEFVVRHLHFKLNFWNEAQFLNSSLNPLVIWIGRESRMRPRKDDDGKRLASGDGHWTGQLDPK